MSRARVIYIALALTTIGVGLLVHTRGAGLRPAVRDVLGDALWAAMIAWWVGALAPAARLGPRSAVAYAACASVEVSQRYHSSWFDAARATQLGRLVLGVGFDPRDLAAYALGVGAAALLEATAVAWGRRSHAAS